MNTAKRIASAVCAPLCLALAAPVAPAVAEDTTATTTVTPHPGFYDDYGNWVPPVRLHAPDTDNCERSLWPPEPVSTSETRETETLQPLPVSYQGPCGVEAPEGFHVDEGVLASAWLVANLDTGDVIAMKDPHGRYRPASIIKVLLALVAIDELPREQRVVVSEESAGQEGSAVGIGAGGEYSVDDLLHGLLMASGNDAAHALAQALGGDDATLTKINAKARELGMDDTRATSYSGLDRAGMSTSAWDMALAYRAAFSNPTFAEIADTASYPFPGYGDIPGYELWNDNQLYLNDPDGIGGKTGYTDDANHTFVGAVNHDGVRLVAVVLDTTVDKMRAWQQAQALLHESYAYASGHTTHVASLNPVAETPTTMPQPADAGDHKPGKAKSQGGIPWLSIALVGGVLVLAALAVALSLASAKKRSRRR
ncbi:D-alanyl-D-alanine carboxypeptidase family protein [Corynebacterium sp. NML130628]|uniref:D-alanyl-D-alanine carboxypeptidase family protein n=1 Tax=Corynebacterium sp. NML130628 TaxID=1906333 RepID=UPI0009F9A979|nr:D-alanyl-D-alanine carboxypeptidase family protein [Corynebacterium sp. NML130628]